MKDLYFSDEALESFKSELAFFHYENGTRGLLLIQRNYFGGFLVDHFLVETNPQTATEPRKLVFAEPNPSAVGLGAGHHGPLNYTNPSNWKNDYKSA